MSFWDQMPARSGLTGWAEQSYDPNEVAAERIRRSVHRNGRQETFPIQHGGPFDRAANAMFGPGPDDVMLAQDGRSALGKFIAGLGRNAPTRMVDQVPVGALRAQQAAERSALDSAAHWSRLEQAGWPGMRPSPRTELPPPADIAPRAPEFLNQRVPSQPQLPMPSPVDGRPSTMFPSYEKFSQGAEQGVTGPANYTSFQRIPRDMIELRGEPYSALWHHDVGHNLGYAPQDIARFVRDQHATPQAAFRQLTEDAARHGAPKPASQATRAKMDDFKNPNDQLEISQLPPPPAAAPSFAPPMRDISATDAIAQRMRELGFR